MNETPGSFYDIEPRAKDIDRLDVRDSAEQWVSLRDILQRDLAALDERMTVLVPGARARNGSNQGGGTHLFVYRVFEPEAGTGIDPVVAGISIRPGGTETDDHFSVSGDISGESSGDILFELGSRNVIGWRSMTEAARDISAVLARQPEIIAAAVRDVSRRE
jgi:hypothetical protein